MKNNNNPQGGRMRKLKKPIFILLSTIILAVVLIIVFISPISKYLIEKYDERYTGRQITMDWAYVNPFTGYVHINDFKIFESKSDSVFFSSEGISLTFNIFKLFSKDYEVSKIVFDHPRGIVIQNKKELNFDDLIEKFSSKKDSLLPKEITRFSILGVKIIEGEFHYREKVIPVNYFIKKVNIESKGKMWDSDTIALDFSFLSGTGAGGMKGDFTVNVKNDNYHFGVVVTAFDLNIIQQYLKDLTNYGTFRAILNADVKAKGNFNSKEDVTAKGLIALNDFHFGKTPKDDYASFEKFVLDINELSPKNLKYLFDSACITAPYFKYERYDHLDNLETMFGKEGSNISSTTGIGKFNLVVEIAKYVKVLARNFFQSNYKIDRIATYKGILKYNDYSLSEKFSAELSPIFIVAESINKNRSRVNLSVKTGIKPYGNAFINLSINPKDSGDFDIIYNFQKIPASQFNPYTITYTSFPLDRGTIELNGLWHVRNSIIHSDNHLVIIDPRTAKRVRNKDTKWLPAPLILSLVRENGNVIDYQIPITGNLKDPKFHFRDVILDLLENAFIKPNTLPYIIKVKNIETKIEKSIMLTWKMRSSSFTNKQEKFIEKMADFLVENKDATIDINPQQYEVKEKEYILFFEAKKKYFLATHDRGPNGFNEEDSEYVAKMSVRDTFFVHYLNKHLKDSLIFTIQGKCAAVVNSGAVNAKFQQLNKERANAFLHYFKERGVEKQIRMHAGKKVIPYDGFSYYRIEYKGELPESLLKAWRKMNELDDEAPRKKFKKERKKNRFRFRNPEN